MSCLHFVTCTWALNRISNATKANDWAAEFSDLEAKEKRARNTIEDRISHVSLVCWLLLNWVRYRPKDETLGKSSGAFGIRET